jgi:hypothetical protein
LLNQFFYVTSGCAAAHTNYFICGLGRINGHIINLVGKNNNGSTKHFVIVNNNMSLSPAQKQKSPTSERLRNLGWLMGLEPTTTGITIQGSTS